MDFLQNSIKTLKKYMNEITNYFLERNSSGFVEGFNNKIKVLTRRSKKCRKVFKLLKLDTEGLGMFRFSGVCENTYSMEIHVEPFLFHQNTLSYLIAFRIDIFIREYTL